MPETRSARLGREVSEAAGELAEEFRIWLERGLLENLFTCGKRFDAIEARCVADARHRRNFNGSARGHFHFRLDDVFGPIAAAGGNVAGQREIRQRGHGDVVGAADAGFEHAAAPHRNRFRLTQIVNFPGGGVAADAAEFHIDDFAGADFDRGAGVLVIVNTSVEADRRFELALQRGVGIDIVVAQRLLDYDQEKRVQLFQQCRVGEGVGRIGVDLQVYDGETYTPRACRFDV